jgi:hypothetical protein
VQLIYAFTQVVKVRGGSWRLRSDGFGQVFLLSSGEDSIAAFVGKEEDRLGRERRMPDILAEVQDGSAFETINRDALQEKLPALYRVVIKECHGAPGRDWQRWLVELGAVKIRERIDRERQAFLALPQVQDINRRAQPELRSIIRRFALYTASLHLAIEANILPWTGEEADAGLIACLERWVRLRRNVDTAGEVVRAAHEVERQIAARLRDQFIHINKSGTNNKWIPATEADEAKARTPEHFDGFVKPDYVLIWPEVWRRQYCDGVAPAELARHFLDRGILVPADDGSFSKSQQVIGGSGRFYVLRLAALTL